MPSDPFVILGIQKGASQSEILEAYKTKRAYYQQHVFDEGEAGADAARMLEVLDTAYQDAMSYTHEHAEVGGDGGESAAYDEVKAAISAKDFPKAQSLLDDMYYRGGEWHYYQAIIFYEKNWLNESKKQLELAVDLEPENEKYKRSLENMKKKIDGTNAFKQNKEQNVQDIGQNFSADGGSRQDYATQRSYQQQQATAADGCCTACQCAICADCCCECLGGDLIRCC